MDKVTTSKLKKDREILKELVLVLLARICDYTEAANNHIKSINKKLFTSDTELAAEDIRKKSEFVSVGVKISAEIIKLSHEIKLGRSIGDENGDEEPKHRHYPAAELDAARTSINECEKIIRKGPVIAKQLDEMSILFSVFNKENFIRKKPREVLWELFFNQRLKNYDAAIYILINLCVPISDFFNALYSLPGACPRPEDSARTASVYFAYLMHHMELPYSNKKKYDNTADNENIGVLSENIHNALDEMKILKIKTEKKYFS